MLPRSPHPVRAAILGTCLALAGCGWLSDPPQVRGIHVDADQLKELTPGTSTRADVTALIGSPTIHAPFDDNTWIYVGEYTQSRIGQTLAVTKQQVTVLNFDDAGVLQHVETRGKDDALPVTVIARTTPSPGTEANFFQQLFGNIGRFVPGTGGALGANAGPTGGAPSPY